MEEPNGLTKSLPSARLGNGKATIPSRKYGAPGARSWRSRLFNTIARILTWYAIITILFRCPATLDECDDTSPVLCKAYFNTRDVVVPHVEPYYDAYAAPYVEKARPYVDTVSTRVVAPTRVVLERYAAPKLQQAKDFAQTHWAATGQPQVDKAREFATENYGKNVAPHVERLTEALGPYRDVAQASAMETYHDVILPGYQFVKPYAVSAYDVGCTVTTETVAPSVVFAFNKTRVFLDGNVWPHLRSVYVHNVEPQLVRIGERLGRYKDSGSNGTTKKSVPSSHSSTDTESSSLVEPPQSVRPSETTAQNKDSTTSSTTTTDATASSSDESDTEVGEKKVSREEMRRIASETVQEDLHQWETKFATAAEEGAADIEEKVNEISATMLKEGVQGEGKNLMRELEGVTEGEMESLREEIISLVESSTSGDPAEAKESATAAVRAAGLAIKEKAEEIRSWREEFELELRATVTSQAQEHFKILGSMRDLALQKLGMKWAWMDGVTYKDWAKYHAMKKKFDEWTYELQQLIVSNPSLESAMNGAADVEDQAMEIARGAAVQLAELKQVAAWKIDAGDATDNFDADEMERAAEAAQAAAAAAEPVEDSKDAAEDQTDEVHAESEPVGSDGSSTEDDEEVHADTAPEVEPEEEPEPVDGEGAGEGEGVRGEQDDNPPEPAEAEPDLNEGEGEVSAAEAQAASEEEPVGDDQSPEPADSEPEHSEESNDATQEAQEHVIQGAAADPVAPEDTPVAVAEAIESATSAAEFVYSDVLAEASEKLSDAMSGISDQVEASPELDTEGLASSASSAFGASVASAEAEMSSALEKAQSKVGSVLEGEEGEAGVAEEPIAEEAEASADEPVDAETAVDEDPVSDGRPTAAEEEPEVVEPEEILQDEGAQEANEEAEGLAGANDAAATPEANESDEHNEL